MSKDVHTENCCVHHGCKYSDPKCSVVNQEKAQSYPCEFCDDESANERRMRQLEVALYGVKLRGYRPAIESGEPYEPCWCLHMPEELDKWWEPGVWEHDHRCSAARELFRAEEVASAKHAKEIIEAHQKSKESS